MLRDPAPMPEPDARPPLTLLLKAAGDGDRTVLDEVFARVYDELYRLARRLRSNGAGETLSTTALVHEAYMKLIPGADAGWQSRAHFFGAAARAMRQILVDAARRRTRLKRGGPGQWSVTLGDEHAAEPVHSTTLLALDEALERLGRMDRDQMKLVELRFFAGLSVPATAEALGISEPTVYRRWRAARAWLRSELGGDGDA